MHEQLASDAQYKAMFGGDELFIKRHYRIKQPEIQDLDAASEVSLVVSPPAKLNVESQIEFNRAEVLSRQMRSMSSSGLGVVSS